MGRRVKELTEQLNSRNEELRLLNERIGALELQVGEYRSRESAVALTLVEARAMAEQIKAEAAKAAAAEIEKADSAVSAAAERARIIEEKARIRAADIIAAGEAEFKRKQEQADATLEEYKETLNALNARLAEAAAMAKRQSDGFAAAVLGIKTDVTEESDSECDALTRPQAKVSVPDAYETPAELMKSIYQLQNRRLPDAEAAPAPEPEPTPTDEVFTVEDIIGEAASDAQEDEQEVITVDSVVSSAPQPADEKPFVGDDIDVELDRLIQDVLGES